MSNELVLESFISFCDDMMIAEEEMTNGESRTGILKAIDWIIDMFTRLAERIRRLMLTIKSKQHDGKYINIPKEFYDKILSLYDELVYCSTPKRDTVSSSINRGYASERKILYSSSIFEEKIKVLKNDIISFLNITNDKKFNENNVNINVTEIYNNIIQSSKSITSSLNEAQKIKKDMKNTVSEEQVKEFDNAIGKLIFQVDVSKKFIDVYKLYLLFPFIDRI